MVIEFNININEGAICDIEINYIAICNMSYVYSPNDHVYSKKCRSPAQPCHWLNMNNTQLSLEKPTFLLYATYHRSNWNTVD